MRAMGVRGLLVYCCDYKCSHSGKISADRWPDHVRLSELEPLFTCQACGTRPAELRPDFEWGKTPRGERPTTADDVEKTAAVRQLLPPQDQLERKPRPRMGGIFGRDFRSS